MFQADHFEGNLLLVNDAPIISGIGRYANDLLQSVNGKGRMISFVMDKRYIRQDFPGLKREGVFIPGVHGGWSINNMFSRLIFTKEFKLIKEKLDSGGIIHYTNPQIKPLKHNGNNVVTVHDLFFYKDKKKSNDKVRKALIRNIEVYKNFDNILTVSKTMKEEISESGFEGNIVSIYPPVSKAFTFIPDKSSLRKKLNFPEDKKLVLSVSTNVKRKNVETVVKTMKLLGEDYMLIRVGADVGTGITFSGISYEKLNEIYNACDVFLFPTLGEGFGLPVIEAMATGLPVVASNIDIMKETTSNAAVLTEPTPEASAEGVNEVLTNREKYIELGLKRSSEFSFEKFKQEVVSYYNGIIDKL